MDSGRRDFGLLLSFGSPDRGDMSVKVSWPPLADGVMAVIRDALEAVFPTGSCRLANVTLGIILCLRLVQVVFIERY